MTWLAVFFVLFTGPDGQRIQINPDDVTSVRTLRGRDHLTGKCLIFTSDGKFVSVVETCEEVVRRLKEVK